jgi:hypothetical protein
LSRSAMLSSCSQKISKLILSRAMTSSCVNFRHWHLSVSSGNSGVRADEEDGFAQIRLMTLPGICDSGRLLSVASSFPDFLQHVLRILILRIQRQ